jgi:hypothetical protein
MKFIFSNWNGEPHREETLKYTVGDRDFYYISEFDVLGDGGNETAGESQHPDSLSPAESAVIVFVVVVVAILLIALVITFRRRKRNNKFVEE